MNFIIFYLFLFISISFSIDLPVVTKSFPPFVFIDESKVGNDRYTGFSIDYLEEVIKQVKASPNNTVVIDSYTLSHTDSVSELIDAVATGPADVAIAGITINAQREGILDFSHSYFRAGLQILAPTVNSNTQRIDIFGFLQPFSVGVWVSVLFAAVVAGHVIWLVERDANSEEFSPRYKSGIIDGMWWSVMGLLLSGDKTIKTGAGRVVAFSWSFFGMILVAGYTANLTTQLTLAATDTGVNGLSDLVNKNTGVVAGTSSATYVQNNLAGTNLVRYTSADLALEAVAKEEVQGFIYDFPFLQYYIQNKGKDKGLAVKGEVFEAEFYGIAMKSESPLKENMNRAVLELGRNGVYDKLYEKWFVATKSGSEAVIQTAEEEGFNFWDMSGIFVLLLILGVIALIVYIVAICLFGSGSPAKKGATKMPV